MYVAHNGWGVLQYIKQEWSIQSLGRNFELIFGFGRNEKNFLAS